MFFSHHLSRINSKLSRNYQPQYNTQTIQIGVNGDECQRSRAQWFRVIHSTCLIGERVYPSDIILTRCCFLYFSLFFREDRVPDYLLIHLSIAIITLNKDTTIWFQYTPEISSSLLISRGCIPDKAVVRLDEFWEVVGTRLVKINNNQDKKYKYVITFYFIYY